MVSQSTKEKLFAKLKSLGVEIPTDAEIVRTYAGYWRRRSGEASWSIHSSKGLGLICSQFPIYKIIRSPKAAWRKSPYCELDTEIYIER